MSDPFHRCCWCPCVFLTKADLDKHYQAFRVLGKEPNEYDHKVRWKNELYKRDHEYIENG